MKLNSNDLWYESQYPLKSDISDWEKDCNSYGYRTEEFVSCSDIVSLGCSMTFGLGVDPGQAWPDLLAKDLNMSVHNLAGCGKSVMWSINKFFSYANKFGNPKILTCLFPEFTRVEVSSTISHMTPRYNQFPKHDLGNDKIIRYGIWNQNNKFNTGSGVFIAEDSIPSEMSFDISIQYIKMLEMYCNTNNIKLLWGTWSETESLWLDKNISLTEFKNYVKLGMHDWHFSKEEGMKEIYKEDCHTEYAELKNFYYSKDAKTAPTPHFGLHRMIHLSESFKKEIINWQSS